MSNSTNSSNPVFGFQDTSYIAAGEDAGLRKLCEDFYHLMGTLSEAKDILEMHNESLSVRVDKLTLFLSLWLGGPKTYKEKYKGLGMPAAHKHLVINHKEADAWILCMDRAVDLQSYTDPFKEYLKIQFRVPAERIRQTSKSSE